MHELLHPVSRRGKRGNTELIMTNPYIKKDIMMWQQLSGQFFKRHSEFAQTPPVTYNY